MCLRIEVVTRTMSLKSLPSRFKMNDKEKIQETLRMINDLERYADSLNVGTKMLKQSLQKIRDVLES